MSAVQLEHRLTRWQRHVGALGTERRTLHRRARGHRREHGLRADDLPAEVFELRVEAVDIVCGEIAQTEAG